MLRDALRRILGRDVDLESRAADSVGDLGQAGALGRHIGDDDSRAVSGKRLRDGGADAPRGTGDHGNSILERMFPVRRRYGLGGSNSDDLTVDVGRSTGNEEAQRRLEDALSAFRHIYKVGGRSESSLLAGGANEAVERALRRGGFRIGAVLGGSPEEDQPP